MSDVNERLRTAMLRTGTSTEDLSLCCDVDLKTVERWISPGRAHRWAAARRLGCDEDYLWPGAARSPAQRADATRSELVQLYPDRASVPRQTWIQADDRGPRAGLRPGLLRYLLRPDSA
jgi:hypothetical protein